MKSILIVSLVAAAMAVGCSNDPDSLTGGRGVAHDPDDAVGGENTTFDHVKESTGGENGITDVKAKKQQEALVGTPQQVAKLHGSQKISYVALGRMLTDFGVTVTGGAGNGNGGGNGNKNGNNGGAAAGATQTAAQLYAGGKNALGAPIYSSRTPEMTTPSTSALAKEFDVFVASANDIVANIGKSKRCPGVVLANAGVFTQDGISCLIGKPATAEHVALANQLVTDAGDPTKGTAIAVATLLAAAHISE